MIKIPLPTMERLCSVFSLLEKLEEGGVKTVSSAEIGKNINATNTTVRKDISYIDMPGAPGKDYELKKLKKYIGESLKLYKTRIACIIGLGRIGTAILAYEKFKEEGFEIVAGFDNNINKVERIVTPVPLYPVSELKQIIRLKDVEIGIICVPPEAAQETANVLIEAGIKGILNCTTAVINVPEKIIVRNIDFTNYLRIISANINLASHKKRRQIKMGR